MCSSYLTIGMLVQSTPIQDTEVVPGDDSVVIALIAVSVPTFWGARWGLVFGFFFLFLQVFFLTWPSCGWLFKFRQGRKLLVQSDCLTACSLLHLLFFLLVGIFNFSHVVSKCFLFIPESSGYKVWIQQEKQLSCVSASSHDIPDTPVKPPVLPVFWKFRSSPEQLYTI